MRESTAVSRVCLVVALFLVRKSYKRSLEVLCCLSAAVRFRDLDFGGYGVGFVVKPKHGRPARDRTSRKPLERIASDDSDWGAILARAMARAPRRAAGSTCARCRWYIGAWSAWYVVYIARENLPSVLRRRSVQPEGPRTRTASWAAMRRISGKPSSQFLPNVTSSHLILGLSLFPQWHSHFRHPRREWPYSTFAFPYQDRLCYIGWHFTYASYVYACVRACVRVAYVRCYVFIILFRSERYFVIRFYINDFMLVWILFRKYIWIYFLSKVTMFVEILHRINIIMLRIYTVKVLQNFIL